MTPTRFRSYFTTGSIAALCVASTVWLACSTPEPVAEETSAPSREQSMAAAGPAPTLDFSFVFFGCNRLSRHPHYPTPSTANTPQLRQTLADIHALPDAPRFLFFLGDLVLNEADDDGSTLAGQLAHWQTMWQSILPTGFGPTLVPITGNHEVLLSRGYSPSGCDCDAAGNSCTDCEWEEYPNPATQPRWLSWIGPPNNHNAYAGNGPTQAGFPGDLLAADNNQELSYSFASGLASGKKVHFTLVDTDTYSTFKTTDPSCLQPGTQTTDAVPGWVPANWIAGDVGAAQGDAGTELIFAMGHKPIQMDGTSMPTGRDTVNNCAPNRVADSFLGTLQGNDKVVAYLTSHSHQWAATTIGSSPAVHQLIVGNAGSKPIPDFEPPTGYFGFTLVSIYTDGKVTATSYGREIPEHISDPSNVQPATVRQTVVLRDGSGAL